MKKISIKKKWYLAARTRHTEKLKELAKILEANNQEISSDWIYESSYKPFAQNKEKVQNQTIHNVDQMLITDIFVAFNDKEGSDLFTEFGVCLAKKAMGQQITLYAVGNINNASMMQWHPDVIHFASIKDVFQNEGIDCTDITFPNFD